jgi:hypothetical protein
VALLRNEKKQVWPEYRVQARGPNEVGPDEKVKGCFTWTWGFGKRLLLYSERNGELW